jgi:hypothetical protein
MSDHQINNTKPEPKNKSSGKMIYIVVHLIIGVIAVYLSWNCNHNETTLMRVLYAFVAYIFSVLYIVYYLIYHVAMKKQC